jgi:hypothetical protein
MRHANTAATSECVTVLHRLGIIATAGVVGIVVAVSEVDAPLDCGTCVINAQPPSIRHNTHVTRTMPGTGVGALVAAVGGAPVASVGALVNPSPASVNEPHCKRRRCRRA